jgi:hypothetical protein
MAEFPGELGVAHVHGIDPRGAVLEQAIDEAADVAAEVGAGQAVGIDLIISRVGAFLREEEELNALAAQAAKAAMFPLEHGNGNGNGHGTDPARLGHGPQLLARPASGLHPALVQILTARRSLDVMVRPLAAPPSYRTAHVQTITNHVRSGVYVRLILDATVADRRIKERLAREGLASSHALQVRHFTPLGSHSYVVDGVRTIRFPILGILTRTSEVAILSDNPERVAIEVQRF